MKKLSLLVGGLVLTTAVMAQKPTDGAPMSIEGILGYNTATLSFGNNSATNLNAGLVTPGLRFRYFVSENLAVRVSLGLSSAKTTDNYFENEQDNSGGAGTYTTKQSVTTIGLGAEYHFSGTEKLSPFVGLDINFGMGKMSTEGDQSDGAGYVANYSEKAEQKMGGFGINLLAGTDYYFAENFYLGLELGLGFNTYKIKEGEASATFGGTTTTTKSNEQTNFNLANNVVGNLRLGWRF